MATKLIQNKLKRLESKEWTKGEFSKQNWGVWMHSISSYVGRIKPSFAHFLIDIFSEKNDLVLDPFGGSGTTAQVASNLNRNAILCELNPDYVDIAEKRLNENLGMFMDLTVDTPLRKEKQNG